VQISDVGSPDMIHVFAIGVVLGVILAYFARRSKS
jgi:hypothetical protein